ncbi:heterokaryon incompatibility protein-domain-containing protein [Dactylonectria macrodidyma]|uniref:Heterokaryon incompatibility protein-domain-containing protein n=1 Tax=Dactylonectria macrodidyma TaxID=307937 RepID=A0A9P9EW12_9HYPO|nr:heterokaryon incompatibility protein-domain-containing protein [Dactylonectria macrodidyma]
MNYDQDDAESPGAQTLREGCTVCANLRRMFTEEDFEVDLGLIDQVLETPCPGHDPLMRFIREQFDSRSIKIAKQEEEDERRTSGDCGETKEGADASEGECSIEADDDWDDSSDQDSQATETRTPDDEKPGPGPYNIQLSRYDDPHGEILVESSYSSGLLWHLLLAKDSKEPQTPGHGRLLDPDWVDLKLARQWKKDCFEKHGDKCHNPFNIRRVSPTWLIDTANNCLVSGEGVSDYVTLSYRWGASTAFRASRSMLPLLLEHGSLGRDRLGRDLPRGIQHAMQLVRELDECYLWVDAVCIMQDDQVHRTEQLQRMGAIYSSATLTIVASDGDATGGILGLQGTSPSRELMQEVIPIFEDEKVIVRQIPVLRSQTGCEPYFDRGWTFQEFFLAKRRLLLAGNQLHWHCSCAAWHEDLIAEEYEDVDSREYIDRWLSRLLNGQPDFAALDRLLSEYNQRKLTYPEDALPGISGLLAILSRSFEGGFLFGLPETCFDSALMWRAGLTTEMTRRKDSGHTNLLALSSRLPSWSWLSWECFAMSTVNEETFQSWYRGYRTTPITQWYTHETPDAAVKRPIRANWFRLQEQHKDSEFELPEGWTREKYDEEAHGPEKYESGSPPHGLGKYVYRHVTVPDKYFWLPVPIATVDQTVEPFNPPQTPYISCRTGRGWFTAVQIPKKEFSDTDIAFDKHKLTAGLLDQRGQRCGWLNLHTMADISVFPKAGSPVDFKVELVAICRRQEQEVTTWNNQEWVNRGGELRDEDDEMGDSDEEEDEKTTFKEVYCVLWVEWIAGVAYRKASGVVDKDVWEAYGTEGVDLILG